MIGPKHIAYASDHHSGMLGEETLRVVKCAHPGCISSYDEHTSDKVMFFSLTRNCSNQEANDALKKLVKLLEKNKIDGIAFVETPEEFRVT